MIEENINILEENNEENINVEEENVTVNQEITYDKNYLHLQNIASNEWIINHNLDKYPSVTVIDSAGSEVIGEVEYMDLNNLKIKFAGSFSGKATLN